MTPALSFEELLAWSDESTQRWFQFLAENPAVLDLPCGIYGTSNVLGLVRHIVVVEMRHAQRLSGETVYTYEQFPDGPLDALLALHAEAIARFRKLLADPTQDWAAEMEFVTLTAGTLRSSRRKLLAHTLLHAVRHWAQLSTLTRAADFPTGFAGDLLLSSVLR
jgi:uncharacterized damage-inducible protein DinB